jgi:hypothetical protein
MKFLRLVPLFVAPAVISCDCGSPVFEIAPQIFLSACKDPDKIVAGKHIGGFESCGIDFGARDESVKITQTITVTNPSTVPLTLFDISIVGDPSFTLVNKDAQGKKIGLASGDVIGPGLSGEITVAVTPLTATAIKTVLGVKSDAKNTVQTPDHKSFIQVPITATGVDNGLPQIDVTPTECNFDRVAIDGVGVCNVTVSNKGVRGLVLNNVDFIAPDASNPTVPFQVPTGSTTTTPFAFAGRPPGPDEEIAPTNLTANPPVQPVVLQVQFRPDVLGSYLGKFAIDSNDPSKSHIEVTLQGVGVTPPNCVAKIKSVNGTDVGSAAPQIQPLDDVVFSLEDSAPSTPNGSIATYQWNIEKQPAESHAILGTPNNVDTGFTFDADGIHNGVDFAGDYKVCGQVFDDLGVGSVNECCVGFSAIPKEAFHVELSWDTAINDLDLHVTLKDANGNFCASDTSGTVDGPLAGCCTGSTVQIGGSCSGSTQDCNWTNCKHDDTLDFNPIPEWDGDGPPRGAGDPSLDVDDIDGFGPENINIDTPIGGEYLVSVEGYSVADTADAQVKIFIFGHLAGAFVHPMHVGTWWEAALVHWPADLTTGQPCVQDLAPGATNNCGP